jgi:hypothetical protein
MCAWDDRLGRREVAAEFRAEYWTFLLQLAHLLASDESLTRAKIAVRIPGSYRPWGLVLTWMSVY